MLEVMSAMMCQLAGVNPTSTDHKCLGIDSKTGKIGFVEQGGGAIGLMGGLIAATYTPPIHTGDYVKYLAQNFGIAKKTYAQGKGFEGISGLAPIWIAFRNIVYMLFVIVFVVIGFAVMLRVHIDPRTVMTIENQIPKIIIGILLVTFSFAIAGFLIDLMYVSMYVVFGVISGIPGANVAGLDPTIVQNQTPMGAVGGLGDMSKIAGGTADSIKKVIHNMLFYEGSAPNIIAAGVSAAVGTYMGIQIGQIENLAILGVKIPYMAAVGATAGIGIGTATYAAITTWIPQLIAYLIIFVAVLWALFRLWFQLIIAYVYILLDIVLAPFWIMAGVLPGSPIGFGAWMREILANLSAFPAAFGMFLVGKMFMDAFKSGGPDDFVPPLIGNAAQPDIISNIIGIGIILLTPQVVSMMRDLFKPPPFKYSAAIGQAVGVGAGVFNIQKHAMGLGQFMYYKNTYFKELPLVGDLFRPKGAPGTPGAAGPGHPPA